MEKWQIRLLLGEALRRQTDDMHQAAIFRLPDSSRGSTPSQAAKIKAAARALIHLSLRTVEAGAPEPIRPPPELDDAVEWGASLNLLLRTVLQPHGVVQVALCAAAAQIEEAQDSVAALLAEQTSLFDQLVTATADLHLSHSEKQSQYAHRRWLSQIDRVLAGTSTDLDFGDYDLSWHHIGAIVVGTTGTKALKEMAARLNCRLLLVTPRMDLSWAWFGRLAPFNRSEFTRKLRRIPAHVRVTFGEPNAGLSGWRLTHRQAQAAVPLLDTGRQCVIQYTDVATLSAMAADPTLLATLKGQYLLPLDAGRPGGSTLRETLQAYFRADRNVSSTATLLRVNRKTVANRLRAVEDRLDCPIFVGAANLEAAIMLEQFGLIQC